MFGTVIIKNLKKSVIEKIKHVRNNYSADVWYCDY